MAVTETTTPTPTRPAAAPRSAPGRGAGRAVDWALGVWSVLALAYLLDRKSVV